MADMNPSKAFFRGMHKKLFSNRHLRRDLVASVGNDFKAALADYADFSKILRGRGPDRKWSAMGGSR